MLSTALLGLLSGALMSFGWRLWMPMGVLGLVLAGAAAGHLATLSDISLFHPRTLTFIATWVTGIGIGVKLSPRRLKRAQDQALDSAQ